MQTEKGRKREEEREGRVVGRVRQKSPKADKGGGR